LAFWRHFGALKEIELSFGLKECLKVLIEAFGAIGNDLNSVYNSEEYTQLIVGHKLYSCHSSWLLWAFTHLGCGVVARISV
jgi:hypothetical protein